MIYQTEEGGLGGGSNLGIYSVKSCHRHIHENYTHHHLAVFEKNDNEKKIKTKWSELRRVVIYNPKIH